MSVNETSTAPYLDFRQADAWMAENYIVPVGVLVAYGIHMLVLTRVMEAYDKPPSWVKPLKAAWDLFLSVMSGMGAVQVPYICLVQSLRILIAHSLQVVPVLLVSLQTQGFAGEVCFV